MAGLNPELLTVPVICEILDKSESAVRRMMREGLLPITRVGGSVRIEARKLLKWIDAGGRGYTRNKAPLSKKVLAGNGRAKASPCIRRGV